MEIEIKKSPVKRNEKLLSFLSSLVAALKVFRRDPSKKLNLSKLRRYLNQLLDAEITRQELERMIAIVMKFETIIRSHFQEFSFVLKDEGRELKLSLEQILEPPDRRKEEDGEDGEDVEDGEDGEKKKKKEKEGKGGEERANENMQPLEDMLPKAITITTSELQTLSDLFELFTIQKFKGFNIKGLDTSSSKAMKSIKVLSSKYPFFFTQRDKLLYFSPICFNLIKDFSKYQKLRRTVSQINIEGITFHITDS